MADQCDPLLRLQALTQTATFNSWLGLEVVAATPGEVELRLPWRPEFAQYHGFLYASIVGGLIDTSI
jgi:acyl-coenzyme A thioesterase PaaI-like protein